VPVPVSNRRGRGSRRNLARGCRAVEIGAAWKKTATGSEREYLSVKLDDPSLAQPIYASLVEAETADSYNLIWSRRNGS